ncbi:MAG: 3-phosphoshikimate 1-carboxyvinyltransferase [Elusimicrobia bacterium]|nr:3-phosphoshikimate 1-carboxyvinyltransferase [Elusimicrobiota bacterium]
MELSTKRSRPLLGELGLPGDKAVSHLALVLGALGEGTTGITGLGEGLDIEATKNCLLKLGVHMAKHKVREHEIIAVQGRGPRSLAATDDWLDCEDSVATLGLLMGVLAGHAMTSKLTGGADLRRVPLETIAGALRRMGAKVAFERGESAPLKIQGAALKAAEVALPAADRQAKGAVLLAGLLAEGVTSVDEPSMSWDHAERMLRHFGVVLDRDGSRSRVTGGARPKSTPVRVPGDMHLAAYWVVAATIVPESDLTLTEIGANPCRTAFLDILDRMGASIERQPWGDNIIGAPEPVGDLRVKAAALKATDVSAAELARAINELPVLAVAATQAEGRTRFKGLKGLGREAEALAKAAAKLVKAAGGKASVRAGDMTVTGPTPLAGIRMEAGSDPRTAMAALVAGLVAEGELNVADGRCVVNAYPSFYSALRLMCL